jgi:hypothetical protein
MRASARNNENAASYWPYLDDGNIGHLRGVPYMRVIHPGGIESAIMEKNGIAPPKNAGVYILCTANPGFGVVVNGLIDGLLDDYKDQAFRDHQSVGRFLKGEHLIDDRSCEFDEGMVGAVYRQCQVNALGTDPMACTRSVLADMHDPSAYAPYNEWLVMPADDSLTAADPLPLSSRHGDDYKARWAILSERLANVICKGETYFDGIDGRFLCDSGRRVQGIADMVNKIADAGGTIDQTREIVARVLAPL